MVRLDSATVRMETAHTVSLVEPHLRSGASLLDVGCGAACVTAALCALGRGAVYAVDIVDVRRLPIPHFALWDGAHLPFGDASVDVVLLSFVLHHVPNERKVALLREALRVASDCVVVIEDTPITFLDRVVSRLHGERFRRRIGSRQAFGFLTKNEWEWLFAGLGLRLRDSRRLSRFCRSLLQPFPRSFFVLEKAEALRAGAARARCREAHGSAP